MPGLIKWCLDKSLDIKHKEAKEVYKLGCAFSQVLVVVTFVFAFILYIVSAAYPAWPLFERNSLYWSMHLLIYPFIQVTFDHSHTIHTAQVLRMVSILTMLFLIHPFVLMCVEAYLCNQLNDEEKLNVATCAAAYTDNYIDVNSQLACANLINVDITSIAHGSCAYLINHVASAVQAFEFIALIVLTFKDALIFFAMERCIVEAPHSTHDKPVPPTGMTFQQQQLKVGGRGGGYP